MRDADDEAMIALQTGRTPRSPWRVAKRCSHGRPSVIVSPSVLEDGSRFPTWAWLTCPHLSEHAGRAESDGQLAEWNARVSVEPVLAARLALVEAGLRAARAQEGAGEDACPEAGIAGQRSSGSVKCLHAHIALYLAGIDDPIGQALLDTWGETCATDRCASLMAGAEGKST